MRSNDEALVQFDENEHQKWLARFAGEEPPNDDYDETDREALEMRHIITAALDRQPLVPVDPAVRDRFFARLHPEPVTARPSWIQGIRTVWNKLKAQWLKPRPVIFPALTGAALALFVAFVGPEIVALPHLARAKGSVVIAPLKRVEHPVQWIHAFTEKLAAHGFTVTHPDPDDSLIVQVHTPLPPPPVLEAILTEYELESPHELPPRSVLSRLLQMLGLQRPEGRVLIEVARKPAS